MNQFDKSWEIHDAHGVIFRGRLDEMVYAWDINYLADWAFEKMYGNRNRDPKWIIHEFSRNLKLVQVLYELPCGNGNHNTWLTGTTNNG